MISARKLWPAIAMGIGGYGLFIGPKTSQVETRTLVLYGDTRGYLSPCGCTNPMSGGITRAATVVRELGSQSKGATFLLAGALVAEVGTQDALKAECYAETAGNLHAAAIAFVNEEAALGIGLELEMQSLSDGILVQSNIKSSEASMPKPFISSGGFTIGAISESPARLADEVQASSRGEGGAVNELLSQAPNGSIPVLCIDGDETRAEVLARKYPRLGAIVYHSTTDPPSQPVRVGDTILITAGYHGKDVVSVSFENGQMARYNVVELGPDVADDSGATEIYRRYLRRLGEKNLLSLLPRFETAAYAGSAACMNCHERAYEIWSRSGHAHAYSDLKQQGHELDPDCVSCHVVGLSSTKGFKEYGSTPGLANVGCESCHGPAESHAIDPRRFRLAKLGSKVCLSCHTLDNSPGFEFQTYWPKIRHGP